MTRRKFFRLLPVVPVLPVAALVFPQGGEPSIGRNKDGTQRVLTREDFEELERRVIALGG